MAAEEFRIVRARLVKRRVGARSLEAARLALVEGLTMQVVADRMKLNNRQRVYDAVSLAWNELQTYGGMDAARPTTPKIDKSVPGVLRHFIGGVRPERMQRRMTLGEFEIVRVRMLERGVATRRLEAAQLALVDGLSLRAVAVRLKLSNRQFVHSVVRIVWEEFETLRSDDPSIERASTVRVPQRWWPWSGHAGSPPSGENART